MLIVEELIVEFLLKTYFVSHVPLLCIYHAYLFKYKTQHIKKIKSWPAPRFRVLFCLIVY
jgi:hypothetical protein